jgi:hypothetical protein
MFAMTSRGVRSGSFPIVGALKSTIYSPVS